MCHQVEAALYEVFVAVELGGMVAADGVVVVGALRAVEAGNVHHSVIGRGVGQDKAVDGVGLEGVGGGHLGRAEAAVAHIALVYAVEVDEHSRAEQTHGHAAAEASAHHQCQQAEAYEQEQRRAQGVGTHHAVAQAFDDFDVGGVGERVAVGGFLYLRRGGAVLLSHGYELFLDGLRGGAVLLGDGAAEDAGRSRGHEAHHQWHTEGDGQRTHHGRSVLGGRVEQACEAHDAEHGQHEFHNHEYAFDGAELVVHGEVVHHQVGEPCAVAAHGEQQGEHGHGEQGPLARTAHHEAAQQEEGAHDGADVDGAVGALGVVEVLRQIGEQLPYGLVGVLCGIGQAVEAGMNHAAAFGTGRGTALDVGHKQREALGAAVAPAHYLLVGQTARRTRSVGVVGLGVERRQFALRALGFLGVFVGVVEARSVGSHSQHSRTYHYGCGGAPAAQFATAPRLHQGGDGQRRHHEGEIVAHLRMVGGELQHGEEGEHGRAAHVAPAVAQQHAADGGRYVGEGQEFPDVARADDYDKVAREAPGNGAEQRHIPAHAHDVEQYEHAEHHHEQQIARRRQPQAVHVVKPLEQGVRRVARRNLERGHAAEKRVGPQGLFACGLIVHLRFVAVGETLLHVGLAQTRAVEIVGIEESDGDDCHHCHRHKKAPHLRAAGLVGKLLYCHTKLIKSSPERNRTAIKSLGNFYSIR